jgi:hypothetical protein
VRTIVAREGWLGLYAGLTPSMLGSSEQGRGEAAAATSAAVADRIARRLVPGAIQRCSTAQSRSCQILGSGCPVSVWY